MLLRKAAPLPRAPGKRPIFASNRPKPKSANSWAGFARSARSAGARTRRSSNFSAAAATALGLPEGRAAGTMHAHAAQYGWLRDSLRRNDPDALPAAISA